MREFTIINELPSNHLIQDIINKIDTFESRLKDLTILIVFSNENKWLSRPIL